MVEFQKLHGFDLALMISRLIKNQRSGRFSFESIPVSQEEFEMLRDYGAVKYKSYKLDNYILERAGLGEYVFITLVDLL